MEEFNRQLKGNNVKLGLCVTYPAPGIIERIASDWDWIWIDAQHGQHDYKSIIDCVRVCDLMKKPSIVRVASNDYGIIGQVMDSGASGVMVPMVSTSVQAREAVDASKFSPLGMRSYGGRRPIDLYGRSYSHTANTDTLLFVQIETEEALENIEEIAEVPGVDVLFFGPDDLAVQKGLPMDKPRKADQFRKEMKRVADAAKREGKLTGTVTGSPDILDIAIKLGYLFCVGTNDVSILSKGSLETRENLTRVIDEHGISGL